MLPIPSPSSIACEIFNNQDYLPSLNPAMIHTFSGIKMVITDKYTVDKVTKHKLETKNEILLAIDSFLLSHPQEISEEDWLKLVNQLLGIIHTRRIK